MDALPDELLEKIFLLLPAVDRTSAEQTCKRWLGLMPYYDQQTFDFAEKFDVRDGADTLPLTHTFHTLLKRAGFYFTQISMGRKNLLVTPSVIHLLGKYCPNLQHLDLSYSKVTANIVPALTTLASRLKTLDLGNTWFSVRQVSQHVDNMCILFDSLTQLESINLQKTSIHNFPAVSFLHSTVTAANFNNCSPMRPDILLDFLRNCPELRELHLSTYSNMNDALFDTICGLRNLRVFELSHIAFSDVISHHGAGWMDLSPLGQLHYLEELYLQYNNAVDDEALRSICRGCRNLRVLNLSYCRDLSDYRPLVLLRHLAALHVAATNTFTDANLASLARGLGGQFVEFDATACSLGNESINALADSCPGLRHLRINQCDDITDESVEVLWSKCTQLSEVALQGSQITNKSLTALAAAKLTNIRLLDLSFCKKISDDGVLATAANRSAQEKELFCYVHQTKVSRAVEPKLMGLNMRVQF